MTQTDAIVFVIDDDPSIRKAIKCLIRSAGMRVKTFQSAQEFMASSRPDLPACLALDVRMEETPTLAPSDWWADLYVRPLKRIVEATRKYKHVFPIGQ